MKNVYFVVGIDTSTGKSIATGVLAATWRKEGINTITQKFIQTGCKSGAVSGDIKTHRRVMKIDLLPEDIDGTTAPLRFHYPASPHLAARLEGREIDLSLVEKSTEKLLEKYDRVLIEGVGGIMTPIKGHQTTLDYIQKNRIPIILVTNPKLGSINHTLLSLDACRSRGVEVSMLIYNHISESKPEIEEDTGKFLRNYLDTYFPKCQFMEIPYMTGVSR